jgi:aminomethyltransferase
VELAARAAGVAEAGPLLRAMGSFHLRNTRLGGVDCVAARTGYTGEDGFELFCANEGAVALWRALEAAGEQLGVTVAPCGLGARDTLRLEARLSLYGNDIDETTNPLEAGLGWVVKLDKPRFLGREALLRIKAEGVTRRLVGFEMTGRGIARHGYPIETKDGRVVGVCTSGSPGPTVGKNIGLGYVPATPELDLSKVGSELVVDCRGRRAEAVVVKTPFYKRPAAS